MSLATRCTACGTIFRVVQDQLRVSEGWVRCGRCAEVFDAREQLFDIDREAPPPWPVPAPEIETPADVELQEDAPPEPAPAPAPADQDQTWVLPRGDEITQASPGITAAEALAEPAFDSAAPPAASTAPEFEADERREPYWHSADAPDHAESAGSDGAQREQALAAEPADTAEAPAPEAAASPATAGFLRQAERASRRQHPGIRLGLAAAVLALSGLLAWQLTWQFRDALQALFPQSAPALQAFCAAAGCELQPWRRIDALTVESSSLTLAGNGNNYKLKINLHNKAAYALALPWVDLSLTDASGAVVARRMLKPADFNLATTSIAGQAEESLQLIFSSGTQRVSGYSIEIFHP